MLANHLRTIRIDDTKEFVLTKLPGEKAKWTLVKHEQDEPTTSSAPKSILRQSSTMPNLSGDEQQKRKRSVSFAETSIYPTIEDVLKRLDSYSSKSDNENALGNGRQRNAVVDNNNCGGYFKSSPFSEGNVRTSIDLPAERKGKLHVFAYQKERGQAFAFNHKGS